MLLGEGEPKKRLIKLPLTDLPEDIAKTLVRGRFGTDKPSKEQLEALEKHLKGDLDYCPECIKDVELFDGAIMKGSVEPLSKKTVGKNIEYSCKKCDFKAIKHAGFWFVIPPSMAYKGDCK